MNIYEEQIRTKSGRTNCKNCKERKLLLESFILENTDLRVQLKSKDNLIENSKILRRSLRDDFLKIKKKLRLLKLISLYAIISTLLNIILIAIMGI